ncbi:MAG: zinc ribbon domain-containing protein [Planctomycetes bacterium]|nr:zinc ribbon domain-containing protein [Planctomycetota bacterium]
MSGSAPGETVLRQDHTTSWAMSTFRVVQGTLILTPTTLRFVAGRFQGIAEALRGTAGEQVTIPLATVTRVEKGFMAIVKVQADREYDFRGMSDASGWVAAIDQARAAARQPAQTYAPPPAYAPPPTYSPPPAAAPAARRFCTACGAPAAPQARFCGGCGAPIS